MEPSPRRTSVPDGASDPEDIDTLTERAQRHGLTLLGPIIDNRGTGWAFYDEAIDMETGPSWKQPGSRFTLAQRWNVS